MKICISFLSFGTDIFAGIENSVYNLALGFKKIGVNVLVYSGFLSGKASNIDSIPVVRSQLLPTELPEGDLTVRNWLKKNSESIRKELCCLVEQEQVDCMISIDALWGVTQYSGAWKYLPCPTILSLHVLNTLDLLKQASKVPYLFRRTVSSTLKNQILDTWPIKDLIIIPNSIDLTKFKPKNYRSYNSKVIFCNSRIDSSKGLIYLIRGFAKFSEEFPKYELWLCGGDFPFGNKGKTLKKIFTEIELLGIGRCVRFLPNLAWVQIPEVIRESFAVVLPTLYESFGRAAIETLACGVPLISSRVGNLPDLVGDAAILIEPRSPLQIYKSLVFLLENPDYYYQLAKRGPNVAASYNNPVIADTFIKIIQDRL